MIERPRFGIFRKDISDSWFRWCCSRLVCLLYRRNSLLLSLVCFLYRRDSLERSLVLVLRTGLHPPYLLRPSSGLQLSLFEFVSSFEMRIHTELFYVDEENLTRTRVETFSKIEDTYFQTRVSGEMFTFGAAPVFEFVTRLYWALSSAIFQNRNLTPLPDSPVGSPNARS